MTRIVTEPIPRAALLAAWLCALSGCSAYDGGLLESAQAETRGAVGSTTNAVDTGFAGADDVPCQAGACVADATNGAACERDEECASAHCSAGLCCAGPDC